MDIKAGTEIRAYDFPHLNDCYMEGRVFKIEDGMIHCTCTTIVRDGVDVPVNELPETFCTPEVGNALFDDKTTRITEAGTDR